MDETAYPHSVVYIAPKIKNGLWRYSIAKKLINSKRQIVGIYAAFPISDKL